MGWTSPRRDAEHGRDMGERWADDYEKSLGRPLTAEELAQVHEQAQASVRSWGEHARRRS